MARAAVRFPGIIERIARGVLHLSGAVVIASHLTEENQAALLDEVCGKSKREIEVIAARVAPRPDVPSSVRRLPRPRPKPRTPDAAPAMRSVELSPGPVPTPPAPARRDRVEPLSEVRHKVTFTANAEFVAKLEEVQALMSHRHPVNNRGGRDLEPVFEAALDLLREKLLKERFGAGAVPGGKPRKARTKGGARRSRHIPKAVRSEVYRRDEGRCTFVDAEGRRCGERRFLEMHHIEPFARGGAHSAAQITLRCAAHNALHARADFGAEHVRRAVERRRATGSAAP